MMEYLLDINAAFKRKNGCSDSYPLKAQVGWNAEQGITGTLLQSTKVTNAEDLSMEESAVDKGVGLTKQDMEKKGVQDGMIVLIMEYSRPASTAQFAAGTFRKQFSHGL